MRKLYEIDSDIDALISNSIDAETGEVLIDDEALGKLQMEREQKIESVVLYAKDVDAEIIAIETEIDALKDRLFRLEKTGTGLRKYIAHALNGQKFSTARCECVFRKSTAVEIDEGFCDWADGFDLGQYLNVKHTVTPNKAEIKKALKSGKKLMYCRLVENQNLTIK